jgi:hypothetical protein
MKLTKWTSVVCLAIFASILVGCGSSEPPLAGVSEINANAPPAVPQSTGAPSDLASNSGQNTTYQNFAPANNSAPSQNAQYPGQTNNVAPAVQPAAPKIFIPPNAAPEQIISLFIGALKAGDDAGANLLFTQTAQKQLEQHEIPFGDYPNSQFQISPAVVQGDQAQVQCNMVIEVDGQNFTVPGTWVLATEAGQWRIRGMVTGNPGRFLDFEKPEDWVQELDANRPEVAEQPATAQPIDPTLHR